jgi:DNA-cytosine methyltransferase
VRVGALCAGYGGLEMGLTLAGVGVDLAWFAEIDRHAAQVMSYHHPNVPNLGDLTEITDPPPVDVVTAGFPCQPVSHAGKRKGVNDERWLIDDVCQVARRASADWLILENVGGLLSANGGDAMARVVAALAANGFAAEWTCVRASDVGAPHGRLRWFCVAHSVRVGHVKDTDRGSRQVAAWQSSGFVDGDSSSSVAYSDDGRCSERDEGVGGLSVVGEDSAQSVAYAEGTERGGAQHELLGAPV